MFAMAIMLYKMYFPSRNRDLRVWQKILYFNKMKENETWLRLKGRVKNIF